MAERAGTQLPVAVALVTSYMTLPDEPDKLVLEAGITLDGYDIAKAGKLIASLMHLVMLATEEGATAANVSPEEFFRRVAGQVA